MSFRIQRGEPVEEAVQRIAREQIKKALAEVADPDLDVHATVHQVRKRCKKLRGLLRLVRPRFVDGDLYGRENAWYRDSARALSALRDAQSIVATVDALADRAPDAVDVLQLDAVRRALAERRDETVAASEDVQRRLAAFAARLGEGRERVGSWRLDSNGFDAVRPGLVKTHGRCRSAMKEAREAGTPAALHEWRKRAKYHGYHLRLLRDVWKRPMQALRKEVDTLTDLLGEDHDLTVLGETVRERPERYGSTGAVEVIVALAEHRQRRLREKALRRGAAICAEEPKHLARRLARCWRAWRDE